MTRDRRPGAAAARRESKMKSQKQRILEHMQKGRKLTGLYATNKMMIMDYRKRISELRAEGWDIRSEMVYEYYKTGKNKGKIRVKYNVYWLGRKRRRAA